MDLSNGDSRTSNFVTNVGIITSDGPNGPDIMSAEWTHYKSYAPALMSVSIHSRHATHENILKTNEFGLHLASIDQSILASVAGGNTGKEVDKFAVLKELGFEFYDAETLRVKMVKNAAMNAECKVIKVIELGDHTMFVGEVQTLTADTKIEPLVYHNGKYWHIGKRLYKPEQEKLDKIAALIEKHKK